MRSRPTTLMLLALALLAAAGAVAPALAQTPKWDGDPAKIQIELRMWLPNPLEASTYATGIPGDSLDLDHVVGIEETNSPEVRFCLLPSPRSRVRFGWTMIRFDGNNVVDGTFTFNGSQFGGGATVSGDLNQNYWYMNWAYEPFEIGEEDTFRAGFVIGLHGWKADIKLRNSAPDVVAKKQFDNFFPALGLAFDWAPSEYITVFFEGSGAHQGADGWHLDVEGGMKFCPVQMFAVVISYRQLEISKKENDSDWFGRWTVRGPFVGVDFRF
jgi:opacity protein-like surface antigen